MDTEQVFQFLHMSNGMSPFDWFFRSLDQAINVRNAGSEENLSKLILSAFGIGHP